MLPIIFLLAAVMLALPVWCVCRLLPKGSLGSLPEYMRILFIVSKLLPMVLSMVMLVTLHEYYMMAILPLIITWLTLIFILVPLAVFTRYFKRSWLNILILILNFFFSYAFIFFLLLVTIDPEF